MKPNKSGDPCHQHIFELQSHAASPPSCRIALQAIRLRFQYNLSYDSKWPLSSFHKLLHRLNQQANPEPGAAGFTVIGSLRRIGRPGNIDMGPSRIFDKIGLKQGGHDRPAPARAADISE